MVVSPVWTAAQHWSEITPVGGGPQARYNAAAIYDPTGHRMIVFGGRGAGGALGDVWALDLETNQWSNLTPFEGPGPAPRFTPAAVYDESDHQLLIWSGQGDAFFNDIWAFDLESNTWTELTPAGSIPNIRYGVASVFDPSTRELISFAGFTDQGRFDDTWVFDVEEVAWNELAPETHPTRRCLHTASLDAMRRRMLVYGGQQSGPLDDIWAFDLDSRTWTDLTNESKPQGRYFAASVYDDGHDRLLVFGGNRGSGGLSNEVWSFLPDNEWELLSPSGTAPSARQGAVAVYVPSEDRVVVFGGRSSTHLADVWSLELQSEPTAAEPNENPETVTFRLHPNYPNPVTETTTIEYEVGRPQSIRLAIYDLLGREVKRLVDGMHGPGSHSVSWDGRDAYGRRLAGGIYLYRIEGARRTEARSLVISH